MLGFWMAVEGASGINLGVEGMKGLVYSCEPYFFTFLMLALDRNYILPGFSFFALLDV